MGRKLLKIVFVQAIILVLIVFLLLNRNVNDDNIIEDLPSTAYEKGLEYLGLSDSKTYKDIEDALLSGREKITFKDLNIFKDPKDLFKILEEISNTNPEVMYYKGAEYQMGSLNLYYLKPKEEIVYDRGEIQKIRDEFIRLNITSDMTDYEKLLTIHDYIVNRASYDERLINHGMVPPESYTSYGILAQGVGVCEGYAKSMKYLLDAADIESMIVVGESKNESHAWNLVKLDGEYYHVDATWNDPITPNGQDILRHNFFNLNDEEISRTHIWNRDNYPLAKGEKYNYYRYNNLLVEDIDEMKIRIKDNLLKGKRKLTVRFVEIKDINHPIGEMVEEIAYANYERIKLKSYSYSLDQDYGIINLEFFYY